MEKGKKLFLIDAYSLIFRSYYVFIRNPRMNSKGMNTSAVFGFLNSLLDILHNQQPTHIAAVFDPEGKTFRNEMYEQYKANREETPEDIKMSVPYIKKLLAAFNIEIIEIQGYEADDVIGTLAKHADNKGIETFMLTPDKDYIQLVSDHVKMYKPGRSGGNAEIIGPEQACEKYSINDPDQIRDYLALLGDASDNIPGAKGIGDKTARKLLAQYQSVEHLIQKADEVKGKLKDKIKESADSIRLSKQLVTIVRDVPVELDEQKLKLKSFNAQALKDIFEELEFRAMMKRVFPDSPQNNASGPVQGNLFDMPSEEKNTESVFKTLEDVSHQYHLVEGEEQIQHLVDQMKEQPAFCFDTETTSLQPSEARLIGLAISWKEHEAFYVAFPENQEITRKWMGLFKPVMENDQLMKVGQNLKYDIWILYHYGIAVHGPLFDTMLAHYLVQPALRHNLNNMAEQHLNYSMVSIESLIGKKGKNQRSMDTVEKEKLVEYAGEDADITWQLYKILEKEIADNGLEDLAYNMEMPLIRVLARMEQAGIRLDKKALHQVKGQLSTDIERIEKEIIEMAGVGYFNIASPKQLGEVLFDRMKIVDQPPKTKTKQYATSEEVLEKLKNNHPIIEKILEYRSLKKLLTGYVEALPKFVNAQTNKIHTTFNQALVATGRLSADHPNLQNIPVREERGREIRKAFVASDKHHTLLAADYSQIELRLIAHMSQDKHLLDAFNRDADIHAETAAKIFKVKREEVSADMRRKAKTANFGIIYGISAFGLSQRLAIPRKEAKELIDGYFESFPAVKDYMDSAIEKAKEKGYVETLFGRRRYLNDINSRNATVRGFAERNAINAPLQGTAADIIKMAMLRIDELIRSKKYQSAMVLQVHDELIFDVLNDELEELKKQVKDLMEGVINLDVPLTVEMGTGDNWLAAH